MSAYYILGSGGFAKEVLFLCKNVFGHDQDFGGFIDHTPSVSELQCLGKTYQVLDEDQFFSEFVKEKKPNLYLGIGDPKIIQKVTQRFSDFSFPNLIHPTVIRDDSVHLGVGNIITAGCIFTIDIRIGSFNIFNLNSTFGHDSIIGNCNVFNPGVNISGGVVIGNQNLIGTNSTMLQYVKMGNSNILGAGSLANKEIFEDSIMVGLPAKPIAKK